MIYTYVLELPLLCRKLYRNDSYLDVLSGGVALAPRRMATVENRILNNNARSLKPLRKPHFNKASVQLLSAEHDAAALPLNGTNEPELVSPKKANNITITMVSEKRMAQMSIDDSPDRNANFEQKPTESDGEKAQQLSQLQLEIVENHRENSQNIVDKAGIMVAPGKQRETWMLHFPLEKADGEVFEVVIQYVVEHQPDLCWVVLTDHETQCDKMLRDINGQVNPNGEPVKFDDIQVNDIFTAPYMDIYYRAVILEKVSKMFAQLLKENIDLKMILPEKDFRHTLTTT